MKIRRVIDAQLSKLRKGLHGRAESLSKSGEGNNGAIEEKIKAEATALCRKFPIYTA